MGKVIPLGQKTPPAEWVTRLVQKNDSALRAFLFRLLRSEADAQDVAQESSSSHFDLTSHWSQLDFAFGSG